MHASSFSLCGYCNGMEKGCLEAPSSSAPGGLGPGVTNPNSWYQPTNMPSPTASPPQPCTKLVGCPPASELPSSLPGSQQTYPKPYWAPQTQGTIKPQTSPNSTGSSLSLISPAAMPTKAWIQPLGQTLSPCQACAHHCIPKAFCTKKHNLQSF